MFSRTAKVNPLPLSLLLFWERGDHEVVGEGTEARNAPDVAPRR
jgi:hypothetical protein